MACTLLVRACARVRMHMDAQRIRPSSHYALCTVASRRAALLLRAKMNGKLHFGTHKYGPLRRSPKAKQTPCSRLTGTFVPCAKSEKEREKKKNARALPLVGTNFVRGSTLLYCQSIPSGKRLMCSNAKHAHIHAARGRSSDPLCRRTVVRSVHCQRMLPLACRATWCTHTYSITVNTSSSSSLMHDTNTDGCGKDRAARASYGRALPDWAIILRASPCGTALPAVISMLTAHHLSCSQMMRQVPSSAVVMV